MIELRTLIAGTAVVLSISPGATAATPAANGPIYFAGSRTENFYPEIYSVAADGSGRANLTRHPAPDDRFAVSPNGAKIAFVSRRDGYAAVYVMNADGAAPRRVCTPPVSTRVDTCVDRVPRPGSELGAPVWSPTGRMLAFAVSRDRGTRLDTYSLDLSTGRAQLLGTNERFNGPLAFSADGRLVQHALTVSRAVDGTVVRRLHAPVDAFEPEIFSRNVPRRGAEAADVLGSQWSPDGKTAAFWVQRASGGMGDDASLYLEAKGSHHYREIKNVIGDVQNATAAWSPNGVWIAFSVDTGGSQHTYLVRADGHGSTTVDTGTQQTPVWSPDSRYLAMLTGYGRAPVVVAPPATTATTVTSPVLDQHVSQIAWLGDRLLFASSAPWPGPADVAPASHLLAVGPDGSDVPVPAAAPLGRVAPDGTRVAFVRDSAIWTARIDGTDEQQLTAHPPSNFFPGDTEPTWSPDGREIAFVRSGTQVFIVPASGGVARPVSPVADAIRDLGTPAWSPDGSQIVYVALTQHDLDRRTAAHLGSLHLVRVDGTNDRVLALPDSLGGIAQPAWSPDGNSVVFASCKGLAVVNADGTGLRMLTHARACAPHLVDSDPSWSPDGTRIVFARSVHFFGLDDSDEDHPPTNLWTLKADGTGLARLTDVPSYDTDPTWLPAR